GYCFLACVGSDFGRFPSKVSIRVRSFSSSLLTSSTDFRDSVTFFEESATFLFATEINDQVALIRPNAVSPPARIAPQVYLFTLASVSLAIRLASLTSPGIELRAGTPSEALLK